MPGEPADIAGLELQRAGLYEELGRVGDFRRGSLNEVWRKCGKANCACAQPDHPGHGPQYNLTRSVGGKTRTRQLAPAELDKVRAELAAYQQFAALSEQVVAVNEAICEARPVTPSAGEPQARPAGERGGSARRSPPTLPPR